MTRLKRFQHLVARTTDLQANVFLFIGTLAFLIVFQNLVEALLR